MGFCDYCGVQLDDAAEFCPVCGTATSKAEGYSGSYTITEQQESISRDNTMACLELLLYVATLDGQIEEDEMSYFKEIAVANGMSDEEIEEMQIDVLGGIVPVEDIAKKIVNPAEKESVLTDLVYLCYSDGNYSQEEKEGLQYISELMGVSADELKRIERNCAVGNGKNKIKSGIVLAGKGLGKLGKKGLAGGIIAGKSVAKGLGIAGSKVSDALASAKKLKQENMELREILKKVTISDAVKQKVILQLNSKVAKLTEDLRREKEKNKQNEEMINLLQAQLDDLALTLEVAESSKTA